MIPTRKVAWLNGVEVKHRPLFDIAAERPDYEAPLIDGIRRTVRADDHVVVVGGGYGVSTVVAARAGADVTVFEASVGLIRVINDTLDRNGVDARVVAGTVGEAVDVWGDRAAPVVSPAALPACDVLALDAEGAEAEILSAMTIRPRALVVEYHPHLGVSADRADELIGRLGYSVVSAEIEDPKTDTGVLVAE